MMNRLLALGLALVLCLFALPAAYADGGENQVITMEYAPDADLPTLEQVFEMYVLKALWGDAISSFSTGGRSAGAKLTGVTKQAYDALVPVIKKIAAGERASTSVVIGSTSDADVKVSFTEPAANVDLYALLDALLYDHPYELYWYDKTAKTGLSYDVNGSWMEIRFPVAKAYAASSSSQYTIDTTKAGAAATAAANAVKVVEDNKDKSDYEKLVAYRQYICNAVSYNDAAADSTTNTPYGDPWQLIYVFDGNSATEVVCEGYAKAFQYLCDMTVFDSDEIACYTVSGQMVGGTGAGGHMWNIVTMDDGLNYLVDVTNCDSGTIGSPDGLFLKGYDSITTYSYTDGTTQDAYRFNFGYEAVDFLYDLDIYWPDDILAISKTDYVPGAVHSCEYTWTPGNAKTATNHTLACTCGKTKQEVHTVLSEATCKAAAVCEVCGTYGEKNANKHVNADFTYEVNASDSAKHDKKHACCGAVAETEGHNWAYTASGNAITAKCADCPADGGKVTISKPDDLVYSGSAKEAKVNSTISGVYPDVAYTGSLTDGKPVNAGAYKASVTLDDAKVEIEFTIQPKTVTSPIIRLDGSFEYVNGPVEPAVTVWADSDTQIDAGEYSIAYANNTAVGTGTVTVTDKEGGNYTFSPASKDFTIRDHEHWLHYAFSGNSYVVSCQTEGCGAKATITEMAADAVYDGTEKPITLIQEPAGTFEIVLKYYDAADNEIGVPVNAGNYKATVQLDTHTSVLKYAVTKRPVTVTAKNQTVSLGSAIDPNAYTAEGLVSGHQLTAALSANTAAATANGTIAIGSVVIKSGEEDVTANYDVKTAAGNLVVTAHAHSWTYSASGNTITAVCSGEGNCELANKTATVTVTGGTYTYDGTEKQAAVTQNPAGVFGDVTPTYNAHPKDAGSYTAAIELGGVNAAAQIVISPKAVTVKADAKSKTYGEADPALTYQADGLVTGEALTGALAREEGEDAGEYAITQGTLTNENNPNYTITFTGAKLAIAKQPAAAAPTVTGTYILAGKTYTYTVTAIEGAEYRMDDGAWQDSNVFTGIQPDSTHTFSARIKGSKNAEVGAEGKTAQITFDKLQGVGTVSITGWTYGQAANAPVLASETNGTANVTYLYESTDGKGYSAANAPANAGSYKLTVTFAATSEYSACTAAAEFTISPKAVTVTAEAKTKVYGEADPALTYQADGLVTGETLTGALAREAGENAGEYAITQGTLTSDNNPNYTIAFTGAKLTIAKKPAAAAPTVTGTYGRVGTTYTYTVTAIEGAEYRMDDGAWQDSNVFSGIQPNSKHTFFARIKGSANAETGAEGKTAEITFDRLQGFGTVSITGWTYGQSANIPVPVSETNGTANVTYLYESTDGKGYSAANAPVNAGSYKVTATFEKTDAYSECTATAEFTIAKAIPTPADVTGLKASYGDTLSSVALPAGWAWKDGSVKVGNVGSNSFDAVYTPADTQNYELLTSDLTVTVDPKEIAADFSAVAASYPYTGQEIKPVVKVADGQNAVPANAYTITYSNNVNVGTAKIMVTDTAGGNYIVTGEKEFAIVKAAAPVVQTASVAVLREIDTTGNEVDLAALLPLNRGETAYSITTSDANAAVKNAAVSAQGKFTFDTTKSDAVSEAVYVIKAVMQNYEDAAITVKISLTDKTPVTVSGAAAASGLTYDGTAKTGYTGTPSAAPYTGAFDVTYTGTQADGTVYGPAAEAPVNAGSYTVTIAVPASAVYAGSTSISFEIAKATVTIKVQDINALAGQAMPALGYEALGLVGTDALITAPTLSCTPDMSTEGVYPITASGAEVGANYTLAYQAGTLYVLTGGAQSVTTRIDAQGLTQVAAGLVDTAFNTVEKIVEEQTRTLIDGKPDYTEENMAHYDVKLQFSLDGGKTWIDATEVNFPANGLKVKIDYPAGTSKDTHDFIVSHMFTLTSERLGTEAGKTEQPAVTELEDGLEFSVKGLSPISVAWKETKEVQSAIDDLPKTGDNSMLMLWSLLYISALIGCAVISRRREY